MASVPIGVASPLLNLLRQAPAATAGVLPGPSGHFAAQGLLPAGCLRAVEIEDVGVMDEPLWPEAAEQLEEACTPAPFGWREQTLLDTRVRHTGEIAADRLALVWADKAFAQLQQTVAQALGLPALEAHLHNLLVYGPGQFFKPHQDTEKHPRMVGTLVLVWPCAHAGGELRVWHGSQEQTFSAAQTEGQTALHWFAFYADCRHEVQPVLEGWRVALTFDLVLPLALAPVPELEPARQQALQQALCEHFELEDPVQVSAAQRPWVLLLDHQYTEHGLRWELLKGADRWRVGALRTAAQALGLVLHLALVEQHESWSALPIDGHSPYDDDEDDDTHADDNPELDDIDSVRPDDLLFREFSLNFWVDADNTVSSSAEMLIEEDHVVSLTPSGKAFLVEQEYEGYMGNYGETLDYWYRRAALVIQTPLCVELRRFDLDFLGALADLLRLARDPAQLDSVMLRVRLRLEALRASLAGAGRPLLGIYVELACALPSPELAQQLLNKLSPGVLLPEDVPLLLKLEQHYGTPWMLALLQAWRDSNAIQWWPSALPVFTRACLEGGLSHEWLDAWFDAHLVMLGRQERGLAHHTPVQRQALRPEHLATLVELAQGCHSLPAAQAERHLKALVTHVLQHQPRIQQRTALVPFVLAVGPLAAHWPQELPLRQQVQQALEDELAEPVRSLEDHSLRGVEWACLCADCRQIITWAESPSGTALIWPAADARRQHVQAKLKDSGAPLETQMLARGRPYSLVVRKVGDRWEEDERQRAAWETALRQLVA